ncbi:hypothetical protein M1O13_02300, partial [Dehalococcoidia bacterium]|nr:hypothetical protein [Dehalococcoidia bacterium]
SSPEPALSATRFFASLRMTRSEGAQNDTPIELYFRNKGGSDGRQERASADIGARLHNARRTLVCLLFVLQSG